MVLILMADFSLSCYWRGLESQCMQTITIIDIWMTCVCLKFNYQIEKSDALRPLVLLLASFLRTNLDVKWSDVTYHTYSC